MTIQKVAILGNGLMGSGIARYIVQFGYDVTIWSRSGQLGLSKLYQGIERSVEKKLLKREEADLMLSRISFTPSLITSVQNADLIIEAVIEDLSVKKQVFAWVNASCSSNAIIASNTSSLRITEFAQSIDRPEKVIGMHFFNPVYAMKLVEVVKGPQTSDITLNEVVAFSKQINKEPLVVSDSPGFVVNRVIMPAINSAAFVLMEGLASAEIIDSAMKLGANYPMGPLALADLIGVDICLKIMIELSINVEHAHFQICPLFAEMVAKGQLGKKTGQGFFKYY
jgi:3-hydroxybutyryl-CoA dehydrogenase